MVSKNKSVGIDIELIKDKIERIATKFMSAEELLFIQEKQRIEHLYVCWCAKEAVYKLHGKKNVSFVENIELKPFHYEGNGSFSAKLDVGITHKEFTVHYEKFDDYMIGFVSDDANEE
jgi:phosphopantetheine--protein transferase-like protein